MVAKVADLFQNYPQALKQKEVSLITCTVRTKEGVELNAQDLQGLAEALEKNFLATPSSSWSDGELLGALCAKGSLVSSLLLPGISCSARSQPS